MNLRWLIAVLFISTFSSGFANTITEDTIYSIQDTIVVEEVDPGNYECVYIEEPLAYDSTYPFNTADSVVLYAFYPHSVDSNHNEINSTAYLENGKLMLEIEESTKLNFEQKDEIFDLIFNYSYKTSGFGLFEMYCYDPHHVFVFYANGEAYEYIEVCLECEGYRTHSRFNIPICEEKWCMLYRYFMKAGVSEKIGSPPWNCK